MSANSLFNSLVNDQVIELVFSSSIAGPLPAHSNPSEVWMADKTA